MKEKVLNWLVAVACLAIVASLITAAIKSKESYTNSLNVELEQAKKMGREAYRLSIPANANPYQGSRMKSDRAEKWLEGYMEAASK